MLEEISIFRGYFKKSYSWFNILLNHVTLDRIIDRDVELKGAYIVKDIIVEVLSYSFMTYQTPKRNPEWLYILPIISPCRYHQGLQSQHQIWTFHRKTFFVATRHIKTCWMLTDSLTRCVLLAFVCDVTQVHVKYKSL